MPPTITNITGAAYTGLGGNHVSRNLAADLAKFGTAYVGDLTVLDTTTLSGPLVANSSATFNAFCKSLLSR